LQDTPQLAAGRIHLLREDLALIGSSGLFDKARALTNHPDVAQSNSDLPTYYLRITDLEGRGLGLNFYIAWFLYRYKDVKEKRICPLVYSLKYGRKEGRVAQPDQTETVQSTERVL
jgi:hypothetical protein